MKEMEPLLAISLTVRFGLKWVPCVRAATQLQRESRFIDGNTGACGLNVSHTAKQSTTTTTRCRKRSFVDVGCSHIWRKYQNAMIPQTRLTTPHTAMTGPTG